MFIYKTEAELQAMSAEQRDTYAKEKRAFEATQSKEAIDKAVEDLQEKMKKEFEAQIEDKLKSSTEEINTLKTTVEEQGKRMVEMGKVTERSKKEDIMDVFKKAYEDADKDGDYSIKGGSKIVLDVEKVTISSDVMSATSVDSTQFPAAGATRAVDSSLAVLNAQNIGFASYRKPYSQIMDVVDVMPLEGQSLLVVNETVTGDAAITPECTLKPIVKPVYTTQTNPAVAVAAEWATTTQLRKFYPAIANRMRAKIAELVMDKVPATVLSAVVSGGSAFTSNTALADNTDPNNYDALGAVIAQLENLGFLPNAIVLNPIAYRNMVQEKNAEGIYTMWNGNAISLVGELGLSWGGRLIRWVIDPTIAVDRFIVGDLMQSVKVGLDNELLYFETDGRTDAAAASASGLSRNIRTHVLERFVATIIPTPTQIGIVSDTFANVKTLITSA